MKDHTNKHKPVTVKERYKQELITMESAVEVREGFPEEVVTEMGQNRTGSKWKKVVVASGTATYRERPCTNALMLKMAF